MSEYLKPQSPIQLNDNYIYPLTTIDQVIMPDGDRLNVTIDNLNKKVEQRVTTETLKGVLSVNSWSNDPPFIQSINIPGLLFEDYPIVDIDLSGVDDVQSVIEGWNFVGRMTVPADNTAVAYCYEEKPTVNIPLIFKVVR